MASRPIRRSTDTDVSQSSTIRNTRIRTSIASSNNIRARSQPSLNQQRNVTARIQRSSALTSTAVTICTTNSESTRTTTSRTNASRSIGIRNSTVNPTPATRGLSSSYNLRQSALVNSQREGKVKPKRSPRSEIFSPIPSKSKRTSLNMQTVYYCPICLENVKQAGLTVMGTSCGHLYCEDCILKTIELHHRCPLCLTTLAKNELREFFI